MPQSADAWNIWVNDAADVTHIGHLGVRRHAAA